MRDISEKSPTYRTALARARVYTSPTALEAVRTGTVPKGDVATYTKAVGLLALKRTPDLLPFCHPVALRAGDVRLECAEDHIAIEVSTSAVDVTGVEVEVMTAAALAAMNVYDMLKPLDAQTRVGSIELVEKRGGKSDFIDDFGRPLRAGVLVCSDSVASGGKADSAGKAVVDALQTARLVIAQSVVVPDEPAQIAAAVTQWCDVDKLDFVCTVGGTGLSPRDQTPEAILPLLERRIEGVDEAIRAYGRQRTPYADLSRSVAGHRGRTLIVTLPGSTRGARESLQAILPWCLHIVKVFDKSFRHGH